MNFRPELAQAILEGRKTVTRRLPSDNPQSPWWRGACTLKVGRDYAVCPGRTAGQIARVRIVSLTYGRLGRVSDDEARREGFADAETFQVAWVGLHGVYDREQWVWRVEFELVSVEHDAVADQRAWDAGKWDA